MPEPFRILFQDEGLVAIDKPRTVHVHPPEDSRIRIERELNGLARLRDQIGQYLYPVHRLDPAASGVLLYALKKETASQVAEQFRERTVRKIYWAVTRGTVAATSTIDRPLKRDSTDTFAPAVTEVKCLGHVALGDHSPKAPTHGRYSWVLAYPRSGVYHQIRRHLAGATHPLIGDTCRGDGVHNRYFRDELGLPGLFLRAMALELVNPSTGGLIRIEAGSDERWEKMAALPWVQPSVGSPVDAAELERACSQ